MQTGQVYQFEGLLQGMSWSHESVILLSSKLVLNFRQVTTLNAQEYIEFFHILSTYNAESTYVRCDRSCSGKKPSAASAFEGKERAASIQQTRSSCPGSCFRATSPTTSLITSISVRSQCRPQRQVLALPFVYRPWPCSSSPKLHTTCAAAWVILWA